MLSVNLGAINNIQVPGGKSVLVPLTGTDSLGGPISYSFNSTDANVQTSLVSTASKSVVLNVSGTDSSNNPYTGQIVLHLFEDLAPATTARIEQLVTSGYYNGLIFHRVLDGFVAQTGQTNSGNDTGVLLDDELNTSLTFTSPGLLAMANRGPDTSDAEFFITAIDGAGTTNPITLANMPQALDFRYTIFGQLVSGFDTFEKIMSVPVTTNTQTNEASQPTSAITITSATLINDTQDAVLRVFAPASFDGSNATITVTAKNANNETSQQSFNVSAVTDTSTDPPFLGPVGDQTTAVGSPATFTLTSTDLSGAGVYYNAAIMSSPANGTLTVDNSTGKIMVTPNAGFVGDIQVIVGVQDEAQSVSYDTQVITVHVVAPTLSAIGDTSTATGQSNSFTLSATDPVGDGLVYSVVDASTLAAPTNATVSINQSTKAVTITPAAGFSGTLNLLARVRSVDSPDASSSYAMQSFAVNVVAPVLETVPGVSTLDGVPVSFALTASDALAHTLYYTLSGDTTNIDITIDHDTGAATVNPHAGFHGAVTLTAGVRDVNSPDVPANYVTQTFALTAVSLGHVDDHTTTLGTPVQFTLTSDPPANGLHYTIFNGGTFEVPSFVTVNVDQRTGNVTITPAAGLVGTVSLRAGVRSANADPDPMNYDFQDFILVVSAGPTVGDVADQTTSRGTPISVTLTSTNAPVGGVFYSFVDSSTSNPPANVTFTIDQQTGVATITPAPGFHGSTSLRAAVRGASAPNNALNYDLSTPFSLAVADGPTMNAVSGQVTTVGTPVSFTATASDVTTDGTVFKVFGTNGSDAPLHATFTINQQTGLVTLTPAAGFVGTETLQIGARSATAVDDPANYNLQSFVLTVNAGPTLNAVSNQTTVANAPVSFDLSATNVPATGVVFSVVDPTTHSAPSNVTVSVDANGHVTLTPATGFGGTLSLLARVRGANAVDDPLNYSTQTFTLTVTGLTLTAVSNQTTALGVPRSFTLTSGNTGGDDVRYAIFGATSDVTVSVDATTGAVTLTPRDGFQGSVTLTAGVRDVNSPDVQANYTTQQFTFNVVSPTLGSVSNLTTTVDTAKTMTLSSTVSTGFTAAYSVVDPTTLSAPSNATVSIDQSTGIVTLTPNSGFTGTIQLLARVRATGSNDVASNYVTQPFTLTVNDQSQSPAGAGNVSVKISHGNLVIEGDKLDNVITIAVASGQLTVTGGTGTSINGLTSAFTTAVSNFTGKLKVDMGKGNDNVTIDGLTVDGKASIELGKGNDTLSIDSSSVSGKATLKGGKGDDSVTVTDSTFSKLSTKLEHGNDSLSISGTTATAKTTLKGGSGTNIFTDDGNNSLADLSEKKFAAGPSNSSLTANDPSLALSLSGASTVAEGATYSLGLSASGTDASSISQWTINWGDGSAAQVVSGSPASVTHVFTDGPNDFTVSATATDENGTFDAGNTVSVTVNDVAP
jgi:cyclophilin family peptidyl-prolyl cis-trans isomerase